MPEMWHVEFDSRIMKDELLEILTALEREFDELLFVPLFSDNPAYREGCEDTKRDALQLIAVKIREVRALPA